MSCLSVCKFPARMKVYIAVLAILLIILPSSVWAFDDRLYTSRPKIIGNFLESTLTLNVGDNITLLCEGELPVEWHVTAPGSPDRVKDEGVKTEDVTLDGNTNKTAKHLHLTNAQYYDTGRYSCHYQKDLREKKENDSVYIFVKDPEHVFVPYKTEPFPMMVPVLHYHRTVIPCLVTDPSINVTLIKVAGKDIVDKRKDVIYDPKKGFTLLYANFYFSGMFRCEAKTENQTRTDVIPVILNYRRQQSTPLPYIIASANQVMVGETFSLICSVSIDVDEGVKVEWDFKNKGLKDNYVLMKNMRERVETTHYVYENVSKEMRVLNADKDDAGVYKCRVETTNTFNNSVSKTILVHEKTMVYLIPEKAVVETTKGSKQAFLPVGVKAFPSPELKWYFNGKLITNDHPFKQEQTFNQAALRIFYPTFRQNGNYTLVGHTKDMNATTKILVKVFGPVEVSLYAKPSYKFFTVNTTYTLVCETVGYPVGDVTWYYQDCQSELCPVKEDAWNCFRQENKTLTSKISVVASRSGYYQCSGVNAIGGETKDFRFIVTKADTTTSMASYRPTIIDSNRQPAPSSASQITDFLLWLTVLLLNQLLTPFI